MRYYMIIILILIMANNSYASEFDYEFGKGWTYKNTIIECMFLSTMMIDMYQTIYIEEHPEKFKELNPAIDGMEKNEIIRYFSYMGFAHVLIATLLYPGYRETFQVMGVGVEAVCIINNKNVGVKLQIHF